jgi:hypothetical protein
MQPCFVPWLGYFEQILITDLFVYLDDVQYTKQDWRNRNQLKSPQGARYVTVPVKKPNLKTRLDEVFISYRLPWPQRILNQVWEWYRFSTNYRDVAALLEEAFLVKPERLLDLNVHLNEKILNFMGLKQDIRFASDVPRMAENKNERLIEICRYFGADVLYEGRSGQDYLDIEKFRSHGIKVVFQDYQHCPYRQLWGDFLPYMSILDLLFNVSDGYEECIITTDLSRLQNPDTQSG